MAKDNKTIKEILSHLLGEFGKKRIILLSITYIIIITMLVISYKYPIDTNYKIGDLAKKTIISDYTFPYYDKEDIENILNYIESTKPYYYYSDEEHLQKFNLLNDKIIAILQLDNLDNFLNTLKDSKFTFSSNTYSYILNNRLLISKYGNRFQYIYKIISDSYIIIDTPPETGLGNEIILNSLDGSKEVKKDNILLYPLEKGFLLFVINKAYPRFDKEFQEALAEMLMNMIKPNAYIDMEERNKIVDIELEQSRLQKIIKEGEILVSKGETITVENISKILAYRDYRDSISNKNVILTGVLSLLLYLFLIYLFLKLAGNVLIKYRNFYLVLLFFILSNVFYFISDMIKSSFLLPTFLLIPFGFISITLPELIKNKGIAISLLITYSLFSIFYSSFHILTLVNLLIISLLSLYTSQLLQSRKNFFEAGVILGVLQIIFSYIYFQFFYSEQSYRTLGVMALFAAGNGFTSAIISLGIMPIIENAFRIPTKFKLLEMSNPITSPILKELKMKAPGTYNHSMLIGDMADLAAEAIGIDNLLTKVGGYFHDIGKMEAPEYFIENQEDKNKHATIKPSISVSIIKAHVKVGIELARLQHLPEEIVNYIPEHHGTTAISYFYHQAMNLFGDENVNIEDYEYHGPKPQSKGSAIVMIADTVEATVRAYSMNKDKLSVRIISDIIEDAIKNRMSQGQFDECGITMKDLHIISETLLKFLSAYYHKRIDYHKKSV